MEKIHEISDFNELYDNLAEIGDWEGLCMNLQVDMATLDELQNSGNLPNDYKKRRCLLTYFKSDSATWERVIEAVAKHPINNRRLAKKIALKYQIKFD